MEGLLLLTMNCSNIYVKSEGEFTLGVYKLPWIVIVYKALIYKEDKEVMYTNTLDLCNESILTFEHLWNSIENIERRYEVWSVEKHLIQL